MSGPYNFKAVNLSKTIQMRNTSVEDSGYYYCELMVRGKEPIIEEVTKLTGTVSI